jgi:hypothetical protein
VTHSAGEGVNVRHVDPVVSKSDSGSGVAGSSLDEGTYCTPISNFPGQEVYSHVLAPTRSVIPPDNKLVPPSAGC